MEKDIHYIRRFSGLIPTIILGLIIWNLFFRISCAETGIAQSDLDRILANITARQNTLKTFSADFKQIQQSHLFHRAQVSEGMLFFDHTGKILLNMIQPHDFILMIAEDMMVLGDPTTSVYTKKRIRPRHSFLKGILELDQSLEGLKKRYDIRLESDDSREKIDLRLIPRAKDSRMPFNAIGVKINPHLWLPEIIRLEESNGDHTTIELHFITVNKPLPDDIFALPAPPSKQHEK